ncbi:uncharacterized protein LOC129617165 [Condylostylus longicornis]|uniref:uncharacterized protein LOC129617165 n=1 Tax=Condylostylus longicornis TaxID=2530218 RepID=UPI00244DEDC7|nr:uncharacterized protein LOC129617165 [Condylostylus longicornis]
MKRSEIVDALREEFQETPLELGGASLDKLASESKVSRLMLERQAEKEAFEEENMFRLARTKADKKAQRLLKEKQKFILAGGSTLNELTSFADSAIDSTFDDPSLGFGGSKSTARLAQSLSAVQQASDRLERSKKATKSQESDFHVTAREVNRRKKHAVDADGHFGGGIESDDGNEETEMPGVIRETLETKKSKKDLKKAKYREQQLKTLPTLDDEVEGKRGTSYTIEKNKGLVRKRKRIEGTARAHNRMKYERKLKRLKVRMTSQKSCHYFVPQGTQQDMREGTASGNYGGEATGIKTHLKKSITLA